MFIEGLCWDEPLMSKSTVWKLLKQLHYTSHVIFPFKSLVVPIKLILFQVQINQEN